MEPELSQEQKDLQALRADVAAELEAEESGEAFTPTVVEKTEEDDDKKQAAADPWAGVNPALKAMFDSLSSTIVTLKDQVEPRLKQAESRIGAMTNEFHAAKEAAAKVADAPTVAQMEAAAASSGKWESLKEDFPEWAEAIDGRLSSAIALIKKDQLPKDLTAEIAKVQASIAEGTQGEIQKGILAFFKPGWESTVVTPEFKEWIAMQPEGVKSLVHSQLAVDAVTVLDKFEESTKKHKTAAEIASERKLRLAKSTLPEGGPGIPIKSEQDMTDAELRRSIGREVFAEH